MYGKIFTSIYDGTLAEDWRALITFQQLIVLCDADGIIDMTPQSISRRTGIPIEHIKAGIEILEKEDKYSRTEAENGRRIELIDEHRPWGWHIVNHEIYKRLQDADTIREQTRERVRKHREKKKSNASVTDVTGGNEKKRHINKDIHSNIDININKQPPVPQAAQNEIKEIFEFWKTTLNHPRSNLDDKRKSLIKRHLKSGYTVDDLKHAITGCSQTPHNMGDNDRGQVYDSLELILRTSDHIDRFMRNSLAPPTSQGKAAKRLNANIEAANSVMEDLK